MPISKTTEKHTKKYWNDFYSRIKKTIETNLKDEIYKLFKTNTIKIFRAETPQGNIVKDIINNLNSADIVIAILTDTNPNVFYELGIRHSLSNHTIMLSQEEQKIPFDLSNYGVVLYKEHRRYTIIEKELLKRLNIIAQKKDIVDSPVKDFLQIQKNITISNKKKF